MSGGKTGRPPDPLTAEGFRAATNVSHETLARLECYAAVLRKWQPAINLVGQRTLDDLWRRHMLDSAQLAPLARGERWLDIGSGAGFPGLVLAILGVGEVHLVESDSRKAAFLGAAIRETGAHAIVHATRIESLPADSYHVVTARAVAPLAQLFEWGARFQQPASGTVFLFPKGQDIDVELTEAAKCWKFTPETVPSRTDPRGAIVLIRGLYRERL
jgi:16S rRNA (guanine527-N7)-methyltransferase